MRDEIGECGGFIIQENEFIPNLTLGTFFREWLILR